jgi:hypothetical protein
MLAGPALIIYLMLGVGVSVAIYLSEVARSPSERWFNVAAAIPFWPLYVPLLLAPAHETHRAKSSGLLEPARDEMAAAIAQVNAELEAALGSLDGWAEDVLAREKERFGELRAAWSAQADRIREMDRLLALPEYATPATPEATDAAGAGNRLRQSQEARRQNLERLQKVRGRAYEDLMSTLAWVRELVSMIHLAKFTGAPASRAEELVAQIAAAVEGLSEVTWQDEAAVSAEEHA